MRLTPWQKVQNNMANYDAGHYFLTMMAPINRHGYVEVDGVRRSLIDHVRDLLITLPTAQQDRFSAASGLQSPFARVPGTHFAHFFVIDDVIYNGRRPSSAVLDLLFNVQLTINEKVDHLPHAYLVLALDFDAMDGSPAALRSYTDGLWRNMPEELTLLFGNCIGFEDVSSEETFFDYVVATQVDTSLPYNDYWAYEPNPFNPLPLLIAASLGWLALGCVAWWTGWLGFWVALFLTLAAILATVVGVVLKLGLTPFPAAPDSDLPSVLKAIYVQQMFVAFAQNTMGLSDEALYAAFKAFCDKHKPNDVSGPRQLPGVLSTPGDSA